MQKFISALILICILMLSFVSSVQRGWIITKTLQTLNHNCSHCSYVYFEIKWSRLPGHSDVIYLAQLNTQLITVWAWVFIISSFNQSTKITLSSIRGWERWRVREGFPRIPEALMLIISGYYSPAILIFEVSALRKSGLITKLTTGVNGCLSLHEALSRTVQEASHPVWKYLSSRTWMNQRHNTRKVFIVC